MNPSRVIKLDRYTNEAFTFEPTLYNASGGVMTDSDVDNVIYCKGDDGLYYKRAFTGPVNVKWFGAKGDGITDDTAAIQKALKYKNVLLPSGVYLANGLLIQSDSIVSGEVGTILKMNPGVSSSFGGDLKTSLLCVVDVENVRINNLTIDGNRGMQAPVSDGEYYGIVLYSAKNVTIQKITVKDCATDGIFIRSNILVPGHSSDYTESEDVLGENITITNSRRNNLSIIGGHRLAFSDCLFTNASGIAPQAGVDIEPNGDYDDVDGITFNNCGSLNNTQAGFSVYGQPGAIIKNVNFINCYAYDNPVAGIAFSGQNTAIIRDTLVQGFTTDKSIGVYASNTNKVLYTDLSLIGCKASTLAINSTYIGSSINVQDLLINTVDTNAIVLGIASNDLYGSNFGFSNIKTSVASGFSNLLMYNIDAVKIDTITTNGGSFGVRDLTATPPANSKIIISNALLQNHTSYGVVSDAQLILDNIKGINVAGNIIKTLKKPTITNLYLENSLGINYNNTSYTSNSKILYKTTAPPNGDFSDGDIVINTAPTPQGNYGWIKSGGIFLPFGLIGADIGKLAYGITANRPTVTTIGFQYFDTTLGKPIYLKSTGVWVDATGATV